MGDHELRPQVETLIEIYNADLREAFNNGGLKTYEYVAIIGSLTETMLKSVDIDLRRKSWEAIANGIDRRFSLGVFDV